jgi:hypothetical protein
MSELAAEDKSTELYLEHVIERILFVERRTDLTTGLLAARVITQHVIGECQVSTPDAVDALQKGDSLLTKCIAANESTEG